MLPPFVLTGATGTGKTSVSLELAGLMGGEIVCADSRQLYRGLDVATGKPSAAERTRAPHHGFDTLPPEDRSSAGDFVRATQPVLERIAQRGTVPLLVGGTGLYLRALHAGLAGIPAIDDEVRERVRHRLAIEGPAALHAELARLDPDLAARLAPRDGQRIARGLEVVLATGRPLSSWQHATDEEPAPWFWVALGRPRAELAAILAARARSFFTNGLLTEVEGLLASGVSADAPGFDALGYREAIDVVAGHLSFEEGASRLTRHTVQYAKRQTTWFRGEARRVEVIFREWAAHESPGQIARDVAARYEQFAHASGRAVTTDPGGRVSG